MQGERCNEFEFDVFVRLNENFSFSKSDEFELRGREESFIFSPSISFPFLHEKREGEEGRGRF